MSAGNAGGPAFPVPDPAWIEPRTVDESKRAASGMSLRDYFAGNALLCIAEFAKLGLHDLTDPRYAKAEDKVAADAYRLADAMLKAREA